MEKLCNLLFELSNEDRLTILTLLKGEPMKLTHLSQRLGYKPQEVSRNISRLSSSRLIRKDGEGIYTLTPLGEEALRLLDGYKFLSANSEYFEKHTLKDLPEAFLGRIGELNGAGQPIEVMSMIFNSERMVAEAEEYVLTILDTVLISYLPLELESIRRGVKHRGIAPRSWSPPPGAEAIVRNELEILVAEGRRGLLEGHWVDRVDVCLMMSEKEVAGLAFRTVDGRFDHTYFAGNDERFHGFCKDLFEYYWVHTKSNR